MAGTTPAERSAQARYAAEVMHSRNDSRKTSQPARDAFEKRFLDEVDPDRVLPEAERLRRAGHARKAYYARLHLASLKARRQKAEARKAARGGGDG